MVPSGLRRITLVASLYSNTMASGENLAAEQQLRALSKAGDDIDLFTRSTDELSQGSSYASLTAIGVATGYDLHPRELPRCESSRHILLVNNLFPNIGTRWIGRWAGPVVTIVHNFRFCCANGLLLRNGRPCTDCLHGSRLNGVVHGCYRGSRLATLPLTVASRRPVTRQPHIGRADFVVAQTDAVRDALQELGLAQGRIRVIPGLLPERASRPEAVIRQGWLFVGRLTPEKGLRELLSVWPLSQTLDVIGDGPELDALRAVAPASVSFLGALSHQEVLDVMPRYTGLVFPSLCWEGAHPMVVREALSQGTPVVAAEGSSAADLIAATGCGLTYDARDHISLRAALDGIRIDFATYGHRSRAVAHEWFREDKWVERMHAVFDELLSSRHSS